MALADFSSFARDPLQLVTVAGVVLFGFLAVVFVVAFSQSQKYFSLPQTVSAYVQFAYACFLKPHTGDGSTNQQQALESFYKAQATAYDTTRSKLLHGREDMIALVASQLKQRQFTQKPVWVDVGGGTGWNIEKMGEYLPVNEVFRAVYLVDLSTSLCEIARARFARLGWKNVHVICQDARYFRLQDYEESISEKAGYFHNENIGGADLLTLSYSLSMIPEFYPVVDALSSLLSHDGIIAVVDFYVQNQVDYWSRNYTGGVIDRHCTWLSRTFWRTWFEIDRVNLDGARRDYLEYRFGTKLSINGRNNMLGVKIPYYIWIGCSKAGPSMESKLAELDAAVTESPFLQALDLQAKAPLHRSDSFEARSKAYESAIINLNGKLPLPCFWYQNHHWRIFYDETLQKHKQFNDEYIYAFTWEDSRTDARLLKVKPDDVILSITSAGDNILSFALEGPKRIHAVDLNPAQNHLLELKVAAFHSLPYADVWKLFGEGRHPDFRNLLVQKLSPHMSSHAFQFWWTHGPDVFGKTGLYYTGGSRHALLLAKWLFRLTGCQKDVKALCNAQTLAEQREIWDRRVRGVLLSRILHWAIVGSESWLWKALGVPPAQRDIIDRDYAQQNDARPDSAFLGGHAVWEYAVNTLDPVAHQTLLSEDNHYYSLCLQGKYTRKCHADYLKPSSHVKLSQPSAFDGLRIHTDEINEVIRRMSPGTLTIAVVMDSMDWFDPESPAADEQIRALNKALAMKGRVLLRSSGLKPWYLRKFEELGFIAKCHGSRVPGTVIDRVNMYASCWICTKVKEVEPEKERGRQRLAELSLGAAALE